MLADLDLVKIANKDRVAGLTAMPTEPTSADGLVIADVYENLSQSAQTPLLKCLLLLPAAGSNHRAGNDGESKQQYMHVLEVLKMGMRTLAASPATMQNKDAQEELECVHSSLCETYGTYVIFHRVRASESDWEECIQQYKDFVRKHPEHAARTTGQHVARWLRTLSKAGRFDEMAELISLLRESWHGCLQQTSDEKMTECIERVLAAVARIESKAAKTVGDHAPVSNDITLDATPALSVSGNHSPQMSAPRLESYPEFARWVERLHSRTDLDAVIAESNAFLEKHPNVVYVRYIALTLKASAQMRNGNDGYQVAAELYEEADQLAADIPRDATPMPFVRGFMGFNAVGCLLKLGNTERAIQKIITYLSDEATMHGYAATGSEMLGVESTLYRELVRLLCIYLQREGDWERHLRELKPLFEAKSLTPESKAAVGLLEGLILLRVGGDTSIAKERIYRAEYVIPNVAIFNRMFRELSYAVLRVQDVRVVHEMLENEATAQRVRKDAEMIRQQESKGGS